MQGREHRLHEEKDKRKTVNLLQRWKRSLTGLATAAVVVPFAIAAAPQAASAADITNPAQHPYPITVTIDGQTYHDGEDTLPGYDDYLCTPIPDVQYDFADNEILYYDDQGDLLATAQWTEWSRISSYATWLKQQQAGSGSGSGSGSSGSGSSGSGSSGSGSSGSGSSGSGSSGSGSSGSGSSGSGSSGSGSGSSGSGSSATSTKISRAAVSKVAGGIAKAPTSRSTGRYKVTIIAGKGKAVATGAVTIKVHKGSTTKTMTGKLSHGSVTFSVPKLARGTWNVAITWPGDSHYMGHVAVGVSIKVSK
jgi:hypothetical protein